MAVPTEAVLIPGPIIKANSDTKVFLTILVSSAPAIQSLTDDLRHSSSLKACGLRFKQIPFRACNHNRSYMGGLQRVESKARILPTAC